MTRVSAFSLVRVRGPAFSQDQANEIEGEIAREILGVARVAAQTVRVPVFVSEATRWMSDD